MKTTRQWLICLMLLFPLCTMAEEVVVNKIRYNADLESQTAEVIHTPEYLSGSVTIPETIEVNGVSCRVTSIGVNALNTNVGVTEFILPNTVTKIGKAAFEGCWMTSITLPSNLETIGDMAFMDCHIRSITLPESLQEIGEEAFCQSYLESAVIHSVHIRQNAFMDCDSLTTVVIADGVKSIGKEAFYRCSALKSVVLGDDVWYIGDKAFAMCKSLEELKMGKSVMQIGKDAFSTCESLKTLSLPESVKNISDYAFAGCSSLADVYCYTTSVPPYASGFAFSPSVSSATLHVVEALIDQYKAIKPWSMFGSIVALSDADSIMGINAVSSAAANMDGEWYSLDGRRVAQPAKGIYVKNGRKVAIK